MSEILPLPLTWESADDILLVEEAAILARVSTKTILRWIHGELKNQMPLPANQIGRQWRIRKEDLRRALNPLHHG